MTAEKIKNVTWQHDYGCRNQKRLSSTTPQKMEGNIIYFIHSFHTLIDPGLAHQLQKLKKKGGRKGKGGGREREREREHLNMYFIMIQQK